MIKFQGEISGECLKYILRRDAKKDRIVTLIGLPIIGVPVTIAVCAIDWRFVFLCLLFFGLVIALCSLPPSKKNLGLLVPSAVTIDPESQDMFSDSDKFHEERAFSLVKEIWDFGEWYDIRTDGNYGKFICQKDLICEGTLEEFEVLFADKIVRKSVKK